MTTVETGGSAKCATIQITTFGPYATNLIQMVTSTHTWVLYQSAKKICLQLILTTYGILVEEVVQSLWTWNRGRRFFDVCDDLETGGIRVEGNWTSDTGQIIMFTDMPEELTKAPSMPPAAPASRRDPGRGQPITRPIPGRKPRPGKGSSGKYGPPPMPPNIGRG